MHYRDILLLRLSAAMPNVNKLTDEICMIELTLTMRNATLLYLQQRLERHSSFQKGRLFVSTVGSRVPQIGLYHA